MSKRKEIIDGKLECSTCKTTKPITDFGRSHRRWTGYNNACKECSRNRSKLHYVKHHHKVWKNQWLLRNYGITESEYNKMEVLQNGVCAICREPETIVIKHKSYKMAVDHDHTTGKVRGLLCRKCNQALGLFRDDPNMLKRAMEYLSQTSGVYV